MTSPIHPFSLILSATSNDIDDDDAECEEANC